MNQRFNKDILYISLGVFIIAKVMDKQGFMERKYYKLL